MLNTQRMMWRTPAASRALESGKFARCFGQRRIFMNSDRMFALAQALAVAKSRQDVPAAMKLFHQAMLLETPAFGTMARGRAENERVLTRFFTSFPDYNVVLQGHAGNDDTLICWGTVQMTITVDRFGVVPTACPPHLPSFTQ